MRGGADRTRRVRDRESRLRRSALDKARQEDMFYIYGLRPPPPADPECLVSGPSTEVADSTKRESKLDSMGDNPEPSSTDGGRRWRAWLA